jgi:hypothetical protein
MKKLLAAMLSVVMSEACGGGSSTIPASKISVSVTPTVITIPFGAAEQFTVTVQGTTNTAVIWSAIGSSCNGDACGTIDANGLYTAPTTAPGHSSIRVAATLVADSTKLGTAAVTLGSGGSPFPGPKIIPTTTLPDGDIGVAYSAEVVAVEGIPPFGWTITTGGLPPGLALMSIPNSFNKIGIEGTPTTSGTYDFSISVQDDVSPPRSDSKGLRIVVN